MFRQCVLGFNVCFVVKQNPTQSNGVTAYAALPLACNRFAKKVFNKSHQHSKVLIHHPTVPELEFGLLCCKLINTLMTRLNCNYPCRCCQPATSRSSGSSSKAPATPQWLLTYRASRCSLLLLLVT
jgi:hypothetical protein